MLLNERYLTPQTRFGLEGFCAGFGNSDYDVSQRHVQIMVRAEENIPGKTGGWKQLFLLENIFNQFLTKHPIKHLPPVYNIIS